MRKPVTYLLAMFSFMVVCAVTVSAVAQTEYDYQDEYEEGITDPYDDGRTDWTNRIGYAVPKPPPRYDPYEHEETDSGVLQALHEKSNVLYYLYKTLNPPFLDNIIVLVMTIIGAAGSIVCATIMTTPEERAVQIAVIVFGVYCWLRLIVIFSSVWLTGHALY